MNKRWECPDSEVNIVSRESDARTAHRDIYMLLRKKLAILCNSKEMQYPSSINSSKISLSWLKPVD
jgi:hypothetical protein